VNAAVSEPIPAPTGHELHPAGALGALIECLRYDAPTTDRERHHVVEPDGRMDVVLAFDDARGEAMVFGTTTRAIPYELTPGRRYLGIRFRPGCSRRMIEHRPPELRDRRDRVERVTRPVVAGSRGLGARSAAGLAVGGRCDGGVGTPSGHQD